jgi:uroporphyrinogen-III synthase
VNGAQPLAGRGIVLTRPRPSAQKIAQRIAIAGGTAMVFPALEIVALPETPQLAALIDRLDEFDLAVFVSANAVEQGWAAVSRHRSWPAHLRCAAVGSATQAALQELGISDVIAPTEQFDSEALLALPQLRTVAAQRIVIFRGEGGRELLATTLAQRGAQVEHAVTYRRVRPEADPEPLLRAWRHGSIHAVSAMSGESLGNFYAMLPDEGRTWLRATPVFVPHQRIAAHAKNELAITQVYLTGPSDDALIDKLIDVLCNTKTTP